MPASPRLYCQPFLATNWCQITEEWQHQPRTETPPIWKQVLKIYKKHTRQQPYGWPWTDGIALFPFRLGLIWHPGPQWSPLLYPFKNRLLVNRSMNQYDLLTGVWTLGKTLTRLPFYHCAKQDCNVKTNAQNPYIKCVVRYNGRMVLQWIPWNAESVHKLPLTPPSWPGLKARAQGPFTKSTLLGCWGSFFRKNEVYWLGIEPTATLLGAEGSTTRTLSFLK